MTDQPIDTVANPLCRNKRFFIWCAALILGAVLGTLGIAGLNNLFDFIAAIYTRLFKFIAVPTIALAIMTTLATLGAGKNTGRIFFNTIIFTLLTTVAASIVGALLYKLIAPGNLPAELLKKAPHKWDEKREKQEKALQKLT